MTDCDYAAIYRADLAAEQAAGEAMQAEAIRWEEYEHADTDERRRTAA